MAAHDRRSLAELPQRLRERLAELREDWRLWRDEIRENPARLLHSVVLRVAVLVILGIVGLAIVNWFSGALVPGGPTWSLEEGTRLATLYVACTNPACRATYTSHQPMDFKSWPLKCTKCGQDTVYRAGRCPTCRRAYALQPAAPPGCPLCAERQAAEQRKIEPIKPAKKSDDAEDPW